MEQFISLKLAPFHSQSFKLLLISCQIQHHNGLFIFHLHYHSWMNNDKWAFKSIGQSLISQHKKLGLGSVLRDLLIFPLNSGHSYWNVLYPFRGGKTVTLWPDSALFHKKKQMQFELLTIASLNISKNMFYMGPATLVVASNKEIRKDSNRQFL